MRLAGSLREAAVHMENKSKFSVDQGGPIAVYVQIENQIQFAIASGSLKGGDSLPSVRQLSLQLDVNPNTGERINFHTRRPQKT